MPAWFSFRRFLGLVKRKAGPGLGGANGAGRDAAGVGTGDSVEIVKVPGGGSLRLTNRFSRFRRD